MRKLGRSSLVWFCCGAIFMVTLGPIAAGAIGACFWFLPSDGQRDDMTAATRLLNLSDEDPANFPITNLRYRILGPHSDRCPVWRTAKMESASDVDDMRNIGLDVDGAQADRIVNAAHNGPFIYLVSLPRPILGGLDNCVAHTLLAPICALITRSMMQRHVGEFVHQFNQKYAFALARHDAEYCAYEKLNNGKYLKTN